MKAKKQVWILLPGLWGLFLPPVGCTRGISEGFHALTGSSGKVVVIQGDAQVLGKASENYGAVKIDPFTSDVGNACPAEFLSAIPGAIEEQLRFRDPSMTERVKFKDKEKLGPYFTGPAENNIKETGRVIQNDQGGITDKAMGPMDEAICRIQFYDDSTGTMIAEANCTGRVKSSVRTGPKELATGVGKAVRKLLKPEKKKE